MRSVRPRWPRALSARRLVLLATVAGLGVAGATIGPNALHQTSLPTYAAANAAEIAQRPAGFAAHVLVCPDKIACHWAQGGNERPVPRAGDKQLDFVEMAPR